MPDLYCPFASGRLPPELDDDILDADELLPRTVANANQLPAAQHIDLSCTNAYRAGLHIGRLPMEAVERSLSQAYAPHAVGPLLARQALADWLTSRGRATDPAHLVLAASTSEAFSWLIKWRCRPGDAVAHMQPGYPLASHLIELEGCRPVPVRSSWSNGRGRWQLDTQSVEAACRGGAKLVIVTSPNNPTGALLAAHEASALARICDAHGAVCVLDEVFAPYGHHLDGLAEATLPPCERLVCVAGLSKAALLPQLKLSWLALRGSPAFVREARIALTWIADAYLNVSGPAAALVPAVCKRMDALHAQVGQRLRANKEWLGSFLRAQHMGTLWPVQAGFVAPVSFDVSAPSGGGDNPETGAARWQPALAKGGLHLAEATLFDLPPPAEAVASLLLAPAALAEGWLRAQRLLGPK